MFVVEWLYMIGSGEPFTLGVKLVEIVTKCQLKSEISGSEFSIKPNDILK